MTAPFTPALTAPGDFSVSLRRVGPTHVVAVGGSVGMLAAALLGSRLLAALNDGAERLLLDLEAARPLAPGALLATLLRTDRYAAQRGARFVTVPGPATRATLETNSARRCLDVAGTREEAVARLQG